MLAPNFYLELLFVEENPVEEIENLIEFIKGHPRMLVLAAFKAVQQVGGVEVLQFLGDGF